MRLLALLWALVVPDPAITPGALCTVTSVGYDGQVNGYAHCKRHVTLAMKRAVMRRYSLPWVQRGLYEIDHFLPLCMGGSNDLANLFPQNWPAAKRKDVLENRLCGRLRRGTVTQADAVAQMRAWK